jgi:hypothetical protein
MNLTGLFNSFINAMASGAGTFFALRLGGWFLDGQRPGKRLENKIKVDDKK